MDEVLEQEFQNELESVRQFFVKNQKNDHCYYRLYDVKFADSSYSKDDLRANNFDTKSLPEALKRLEEDIRQSGSRAKAFWLLRHYTTKQDPSPINFVFRNVLHDPQSQKSTAKESINGIGSFGTIGGGLVQLLQKHHEETTDLRNQFMEYKHQQELSKLEERIEGLESQKRTFLDSINDFLATPTGEQLGGALLSLIQLKFLSPGVQMPAQQVQQPKQEQATRQQDNNNVEKQNQLIQVNKAMDKLHKVFGNDAIGALVELANFCESNPQVASQILANRRQTQPPTNSEHLEDQDDENDD